MAHRRRRRPRQRNRGMVFISLCLVGFCVWWLYPRPQETPAPTSSVAEPGLSQPLRMASVLPDGARPTQSQAFRRQDSSVRLRTHAVGAALAGKAGVNSNAGAGGSRDGEGAPTADALIEAGRRALEQQDLIAARSLFSEAAHLEHNEQEGALLHTELTRLGNATVFSPAVLQGDPLASRYIIQSGDTLGKIAKANKVTPELLARINGITNPNIIRAGQTIKIVKGPFHAVVARAEHSLTVYIGDTIVGRFPVGLGTEGSTPSGTWRVGTKLKNPTYYPPRGGRIIHADSPENPLGERWIGLEGVSGEAVGQLRYGIHGTNEPESIGRNASLGCIRLHNADVEALYTYLIPEASTVVVN